MKISFLVATLALSLIIFNGCSTSTHSSRSSEVPSVAGPKSAAEVALRQEMVGLSDQTRLAEMSIESDVSGEILRLKGKIPGLTSKANAVGGQAGLDFRKQLDAITVRLDKLEQTTAARLLEVQIPPAEDFLPGTGVPVITGSFGGQATTPYPGRTTDSSGVRTVPPPTSTTPTPPPSQGSGLYEKGKTAFDQKRYAEAQSNFKDYLAAEPKGSNAAAAQFYIGETHYARQQYEEAILEYQKVIQDFPKSSQVPTTLLKQGISFQILGDASSAKTLYKRVLRDYPKSYAAGVAKERKNKL